MDVRHRLGRNVRRYRLERELSQEALADEAGIHRTYVSDVERGSRNPTIVIVEKLALALAVSASDLLA